MSRTISLALAFAALALAPRAEAVTFTVNATTDAVDLAPGDGSCDTDPGPANVCTLRAAVQEANAFGGSDVILLGAGTHVLTLAGIEEDAAAGDLDVTSTLAILGAGTAATVIEQTTGDRVFETGLGSHTLELRDLTLTGGDVAEAPNSFGGGVRNIADLRLERVHVIGNHAQVGGGIANFKTMTGVDVVVSDNTATSRGAGIASASFSASAAPPITLALTNATIGPNTSAIGPTEMELANATGITLTNLTVSPDTPGVQSVTIGNQDATLVHVTVLGGLGLYSFDESHVVTFANSAIEYCTSSEGSTPIVIRNGVNASTDAGCGFAAAGGEEGELVLGPLADNGGATPTHLPLAGSPLLDAAGEAFCVETDQRGFPRPRGSACDIGAIEVPEPSGALAGAAALLGVIGLARRRTA